MAGGTGDPIVVRSWRGRLKVAVAAGVAILCFALASCGGGAGGSGGSQPGASPSASHDGVWG